MKRINWEIIGISIIFLLFCYFLQTDDNMEHLKTFNGRMAVDDQYFYDQVFDNVVYYPNRYVQPNKIARLEEIGKLIKKGMNECYEKCNGRCVEYGISGHAYCFQNA